jgi:hypothetical protein
LGIFLRDQMLLNVRVRESDIRALTAALETAVASAPAVPDQTPWLHYLIRFDEQGNRAFTLDDLLGFFSGATAVERLILTLETPEAVKTQRNLGTYIEISLDRDDPSRCYMRVSSDAQGWVNSHFSTIAAIFSKLKTKHGLVRAQPFVAAIQTSSMVVGYTLSLLAAQAIAPNLTIDNAVIFAFIFVLLVYSHFWGLLSPALSRYMNKGFPIVRFDNGKRRIADWLVQGFVTSAIWAAVGWFALEIGGNLLPRLTGLIK